MRITFAIWVRVVFAVTGDPLARYGAGGEPEPESHRNGRQWMERHAGVRHASVQIDGRRQVGEVS